MKTEEIPLTVVARSSAQEREASRHELTIKAASSLFAEFGVPRSPRSVQGFCKDGHIDCVRIKGPTGDKYFVDRNSVERYAKELKQIEAVGKISFDEPSAQQREPARESAQQRAVVIPKPFEETALEDDRIKDFEDSVRALKEENLNLKIDNRGKEIFINQLVEDRGKMMDKVQEISYKLGVSESRLQQLEAPKEEVRNSAQDREAARSDEVHELSVANQLVQENEIIESSTAIIENKNPDTSSAIATDQPPRSFWKKLFQ